MFFHTGLIVMVTLVLLMLCPRVTDTADVCVPDPCKYGTCSPHGDTYLCDCLPGAAGRNCSRALDPCMYQPCIHGDCTILEGEHSLNFTCSCHTGYAGRLCNNRENIEDYTCSDGKLIIIQKASVDYCSSSPCAHGSCESQLTGHVCECDDGYFGENCETEENPCVSNPCYYGTCTKLGPVKYECACFPQYYGRNCDLASDHCSPNPCVRGTCMNHVTNYTCECDNGYMGSNCSEAITDHCSSSPCLHGKCTNHVTNYTCDCDTGYVGKRCNQAIRDMCSPDPCVHGKCRDHVTSFSCQCVDGYTGHTCNQVSTERHCLPNPCAHGGCINYLTGHVCLCDHGYTGETCDQVVVDLCSSSPCVNGTCVDNVIHFTCICDDDFTGTLCDQAIVVVVDLCVSNPCVSGTCVDNVTNFTCVCDDDFTGTLCDQAIVVDVDLCVSSPCVNGTCVDNVTNFTCLCDEDFTGALCDQAIVVDVDLCVSNPCVNGICVDNVTNFTCVCDENFTGTLCDQGLPTHNGPIVFEYIDADASEHFVINCTTDDTDEVSLEWYHIVDSCGRLYHERYEFDSVLAHSLLSEGIYQCVSSSNSSIVYKTFYVSKKFSDTTCSFDDADEHYNDVYYHYCTWTFDRRRINANETLIAGPRPSDDTSPLHHLGEQPGKYLFIAEESSSSEEGHMGILRSQILEANQTKCLNFYYMMYGGDDGYLSVHTFDLCKHDPEDSLFWIISHQGPDWQECNVTIPGSLVPNDYQISISGTKLPGDLGSIAIDDVSILDSDCLNDTPSFRLYK